MDVGPEHTFEPARFFEVLLPALLETHAEATRALSGVLQFHLVTEHGQRSWFVRLDPARLIEGQHEAPDVTITLDGPVVLPMMLGELDVDRALARGEVHVEGSAAVLAPWVQLFASTGSILEVRGRSEP